MNVDYMYDWSYAKPYTPGNQLKMAYLGIATAKEQDKREAMDMAMEV